MLDYMRQRSRSTIIYIFFGIIILAFIINFGPQSSGCQPTTVETVAKVNGESIDTVDLRTEYVRHFGGSLARDLDRAGYLNQRRDTLETIINMVLLAKEAERLGLVVTPDELRESIMDPERNPFYRSLEVDGKFSAEQYRRMVNGFFQTTMERYERIRTWELLARKLVRYWASLLRVSDQEVLNRYRERETKVDLAFIALRPATQKVSEEVTAEEQSRYATDSAEEIKKYYEAHTADFDLPRQVRLRQIFLASPASDSAAKRAAVKKRAEELRKQIAEGADMAALAAKDSADAATKAKGGDAGWISEGAGDKAIEAAAFALKKGELSKVVETAKGYFILRAEDTKAAKKQTLEQATPEIAKILVIEDRRKAAARVEADRLLAAARAGKTLAEVVAPAAPAEGEEAPAAAPRPQYEVQETGVFTQEGRSGASSPSSFTFSRPWDQIPKIGRSKEISLAAFSLTKEQPVASQAYESNGAWYVIRLKDRIEPKLPISDKDRVALRTQLLRDKERKVMGDWQRALFTPASQRFFGAPPKLGPWMQRQMDRLREEASIYRNLSLFVPQEEAPAADESSSGDAPAPAPTGGGSTEPTGS